MKEKILFIRDFCKEVSKDDLYSIANTITYRLVLSILPLLIFVISIIGFFNIESEWILQQVGDKFPFFVYDIVEVFVYEVIDTKNITVFSFSLLIALYTLSSSVLSIIKGINKTYGYVDTRSKFMVRIISVIWIFLFTFGMLFALLALVFGGSIYSLLFPFFDFTISLIEFERLSYMASVFILMISIIVIYKVAINNTVSIINLIPGALITIVGWLLASQLFDIYINNFSRYSTVYGGIGSVFILMIWLNMISFIMLVGSKFNAMLKIEDNS